MKTESYSINLVNLKVNFPIKTIDALVFLKATQFYYNLQRENELKFNTLKGWLI